MDDEDITPQGVDPAGVHHCILGKHIAYDSFVCVCMISCCVDALGPLENLPEPN